MKKPRNIKVNGYVATPKRSRAGLRGQVEWYWVIRYRRDGVNRTWTLGWLDGPRKADRAFHDWLAENADGQRRTSRVAHMVPAIEAYLNHTETLARRPRTLANVRYVMKQFGAFLDDASLSESRLDAFTDIDFEAFDGWLHSKDYSPQTRLNATRGVRQFLLYCERSRWIDNAPKAPKVEVPIRDASPSEERVKAVVEAVTTCVTEPRLPTLVRLLVESGLRISEAIALRPADVEIREDLALVHVRPNGSFKPKTPHSKRAVPIKLGLASELLQLEVVDGRMFGTPYEREYHFWRHRYLRALQQAEVEYVPFHDLRRFCSMGLLEASISLPRYRRWMGHSATVALRHYAVAGVEDVADAFRSMQGEE